MCHIPDVKKHFFDDGFPEAANGVWKQLARQPSDNNESRIMLDLTLFRCAEDLDERCI